MEIRMIEKTVDYRGARIRYVAEMIRDEVGEELRSLTYSVNGVDFMNLDSNTQAYWYSVITSIL